MQLIRADPLASRLKLSLEMSRMSRTSPRSSSLLITVDVPYGQLSLSGAFSA